MFLYGDSQNMSFLHNISDVVSFFPHDSSDIEVRVKRAIANGKKCIDDIVEIPAHERTYENTAKALDRLESLSELAIMFPVLEVVMLVYPAAEMRNIAEKKLVELEKFATHNISNNPHLFRAFKDYVEGTAAQEELSDEQRYYLQERLNDFKRNGMHLDQENLAEVEVLKNRLTELGLSFEKNINDDDRTITVTREELAGLSDDFIKSLKQTDEGLYILGMDYPTYFAVIDHCDVATTRKKIYRLFQNRAYPINEPILKEIITLRDKLAKKLGFKSFAELDLDSQMSKSPETAQRFLDELHKKVSLKEDQEFETFKNELPASVSLTDEGTFYPWDVRYIIEQHKKKHFDIDETKIAEYFPMEKTIEGLLSIYEQFLGLKFKQQPIKGLWHEDVSLVEVHDNTTGNLIGYLLLDLYPRENKYTHACQAGIIPAVKTDDVKLPPSLVLIIANFSKSTSSRPSLLRRNEVETFFHEFGHAMHSLLGRTSVASFAGTHVKTDFVEVPSQMFEEWLGSKGVLKMISCHHETGESLPDTIIDNIIAAKKLSKGWWTQRQIFLSRLSLDYFEDGIDKDVYGLMQNLHNKLCPHQLLDVNDHKYSNFGHLVGYGAKYYSYLWSLVFAIDLFAEIKKHGLLNQEVGKRFIADVLSKGGSADPQELIQKFLGREPNQENFLNELGFNDSDVV